MTNAVKQVTDLLSAPMEAVIIALGIGVARAQREMDRLSIELQREIDQDPALAELGLQATWYQMPHTELELTMAIAMEQRSDGDRAPAAGPVRAGESLLLPYKLKQVHLQPVNAAYTSQFDYDVQASSKLKLTIVPVPPPTADAAIVARMTEEEVLAVAGPHLLTEADGSPLADTRVSVTFSGLGRVWTVLQYRLVNGGTERVALVVIDDDTGVVVKHETG